MFDVDGTLTPARKDVTPEVVSALKKLRQFTATAFVGGSDLVKIEEQLGATGEKGGSFFLVRCGAANQSRKERWKEGSGE